MGQFFFLFFGRGLVRIRKGFSLEWDVVKGRELGLVGKFRMSGWKIRQRLGVFVWLDFWGGGVNEVEYVMRFQSLSLFGCEYYDENKIINYK